MSRPTLEVADILRVSGSSFLTRHGSRLVPQHRKVMDAIVRCRTRRSAIITIGAPAADIRPSPITPRKLSQLDLEFSRGLNEGAD